MNKNLGKLFFTTFIKTFAVVAALSVLAYGAYSVTTKLANKDKNSSDKQVTTEANNDEETDEGYIATAIFGENTFQGGLDYFIVKIYNTKNQNLDYVFIPNNTYVEMSDETYKTLSANNSDMMQKISLSRIGLYYNRSDKYTYTVLVLEDMLGIDIKYYEAYSESQFESLINLVTPFTYNIPVDYSYKDSNGQIVNVTAGDQEITGSIAVSLMRDSDSFDNGEMDRLSVAQGYLKQYISFINSFKDESTLREYINYKLTYAQANYTIDDIDSLIPDMFKINAENIGYHTVPGEINDKYYYVDVEKAKTDINTIITSEAYEGAPTTEGTSEVTTEGSTEATTAEEVSSKDKKIEIYNSTNVSGLAKKWKTTLTNAGYTNISKVANYDGSTISNTKIIVSQDGMGQDLVGYFSEATVEVGSLPDGVDIQIIIGSADSN